jgi:hypothetical protein
MFKNIVHTCLQILCTGNIQCGVNVPCKEPIFTPCILLGMCSWIDRCTACTWYLPRSPSGGGISNVGRSGSCGDHLGNVKTDEVYILLAKLASSTWFVSMFSWKSRSHTFSGKCLTSISLDVCVSVRVCMGLSLCVCPHVSASRSHYMPQCRTLYMGEQLGEWQDDIHRRAPRLRSCLQQPQMQSTNS